MPHSIRRNAARLPCAILVCLIGFLPLCTGCQPLAAFPGSIQFPWRRTQPVLPVASPPTYSTFVAPSFASAPPRRVVMIEAGPADGNYGPSKRMIAELASHVRSAGLFEIITPPETRLSSHMDNILNGKFHELEVAQLARQYNANAVAFVRVNELRGYAPMRASVTIAIVDSAETVVVFAVDGNWNLTNAATHQEFVNYVDSGSPSVPGSNVVQLQSPTALLEFASAQIVAAIGDSIRRR